MHARTRINNKQTSWGSRADGDANDPHRMTPRPRRSESITSPPNYHPGLIRYNDSKSAAYMGTKPAVHVEEKAIMDDGDELDVGLSPADEKRVFDVDFRNADEKKSLLS